MYKGDFSRKSNLVEYGFRLPSALDNRPLRFEEFEKLVPQVIHVSATPGDYEMKHSDNIVEQLVRPTGLLDPEIEVRPVATQVDDVMSEISERAARNERVLITTLTKRMAEALTDYLLEHGKRVRYLHSDIDTVERVEIIREIRAGRKGFNVRASGGGLDDLVHMLALVCEWIVSGRWNDFLSDADPESLNDNNYRMESGGYCNHPIKRLV